ncbi:alginate export family protein [Colwellia sp. D2M02]|uniref:alginate export family protein n=1 Tax=Colwellia sp. D2M02 TaxID=2841562 RepID=UPI001C098A2C|nr:alginate export family protein [Colwellia sp. D2M02]MBU2894855.1 alginate export family protein [Colwellia sp. D2M02]
MNSIKYVAQKKLALSIMATAILATPIAFATETKHGNGITHALNDSKIDVNLRARYEGVDQDGFDKSAEALTLKSRITISTGSYHNFSLGLEVDDVHAFIDDYNSQKNGNTQYPVVLDPQGTDINQAYLKYLNQGVSVTVGRQRILHNNQRFVGGVSWRQNEQTYDGVRAQYQTDKLVIDYSYIHNINDIAANDVQGDFHLANAKYEFNKNQVISAFGYLLDYDIALTNSSNTIGALYQGNFNDLFVNASLASQSEHGNNPNNYNALYVNAEVGYKLNAIVLLAGYELLGSDSGVAFNTPLATKHKFNGWADKFLGTPNEGLQDVYLTVKGKLSEINWSATYHKFSSDQDNIDFGNELDLIANYKINNNYSMLAKIAHYNDGGSSKITDTNKLWLQLTAQF